MSICRDCKHLGTDYIETMEDKYPYAVCRRMDVTIPRKDVDMLRDCGHWERS